MQPIREDQAIVNVTYGGRNGDLPDPVRRDASKEAIRGWVEEALKTGGIPGIPADRYADLRNFVIDDPVIRDVPGQEISVSYITARPKTPVG